MEHIASPPVRGTSAPKGRAAGPPKALIATYAVFFAGIWAVYSFVAEGEFSALVTVAVIVQCLAFALLAVQSHISGVATGISAKALAIEALSLVCRSSSTLFFNGYLPVDDTGDFVFQLADVCSFLLVGWLLYRVLVVQRASYQEKEDGLPALPVVAVSFALGILFHGNMNNRPVFDALWLSGLFLGIFAVLPQLWMLSGAGGRAEGLTSHYIAAMAASRLISGIFMWYARDEITSVPWIEGYNHAPAAILTAHGLHMVLLADFGYFYVKRTLREGLQAMEDFDFCTFA